MHSLLRAFALVCLAALPPCASAIDKTFFGKLDPGKAERVLMSIQASLFYPLYQDGGNVIIKVPGKTWFAPGGPYEDATPLFTRPQRAIEYAQRLGAGPRRVGGVKATNMNRILVAVYATRDAPNSTDPAHPDFVVLDGLHDGLGDQPETLFDAQHKPFVYTLNGRKFVPAFLSANDAIAFVAKLKAAGVDGIDRIGLDFRSHLQLVQDYIDSDTPIITFGTADRPGEAERLMDAWSREAQR